jgi:hypothetical protein
MGLEPQHCPADPPDKEKCKKPKSKSKKNRGAWIVYYLCRMISKGVDDPDTQSGPGSPRPPKDLKKEPPSITQPYDPPKPPSPPNLEIPPARTPPPKNPPPKNEPGGGGS